jgi:DNA sulfur modification protein DndD
LALQEIDNLRDDNLRRRIHDLSDQDIAQVTAWLGKASVSIGEQGLHCCCQLQEVEQRLSEVRENLRRAPSEDVLKPLMEQLADVQQRERELLSRQHELLQRQGALNSQRDAVERELERAVDEFEKAQVAERGSTLALRSRSALRAFRDARLLAKLDELEENLVEAFNRICRKDYLLSRVKVEPKDFSLTLRGASGGWNVRLEAFSAGERQLFGLAMLEALRRVSDRHIPLIMDTPLARLDEAHRERVLLEYLPETSEQVVLLVTDAEIDHSLQNQVQRLSNQAFRIDHDPDERLSRLTRTYSSPNSRPRIQLQQVGGS